MENHLLDRILKDLNTYEPGETDVNDFRKQKDWLSVDNFEEMLDYLIKEEYVRRSRRSEWNPPKNGRQGYNIYYEQIALTPKGLRFITQGGFTDEASYKTQTLNIAKQSRNYSMWALVVSILAIIISLFLYLIG